jgi:hypothetical protein
VWQGGTLPIPWEAQDCQLDSDARLVDPARLPTEVLRLTNPLEWDETEVLALCAHIDAGQREELPVSQIFQFARVNDGSFHDGYMDVMSPRATLRYSGASRLYVARLLRHDPEDVYALREIIHQLPHPTGSPYEPLSQDDLRDIQAHSSENPELTDLIQYLFEYEEAVPVHVRVSSILGISTRSRVIG